MHVLNNLSVILFMNELYLRIIQIVMEKFNQYANFLYLSIIRLCFFIVLFKNRTRAKITFEKRMKHCKCFFKFKLAITY